MLSDLQQELQMAIRRTLSGEPERVTRDNLHPIAQEIARA